MGKRKLTISSRETLNLVKKTCDNLEAMVSQFKINPNEILVGDFIDDKKKLEIQEKLGIAKEVNDEEMSKEERERSLALSTYEITVSNIKKLAEYASIDFPIFGNYKPLEFELNDTLEEVRKRYKKFIDEYL